MKFLFTVKLIFIFLFFVSTTVEAVTTIPTGIAPAFSVNIENKLYVSRVTGLTVINTDTDTIAANVSAPGTNPYYLATIGRKVYAASGGNDAVFIVDSTTDTKTNQFSVGDNPFSFSVVGNKMYLPNTGSDTVSIINTGSEEEEDTISVGDAPQFSTVVGRKLYVVNSEGDSVSVIDTTTNTVTSTISVGDAPRLIITVGTKVYVFNLNGNSISVINSETDTVIATIPVGTSPYHGSYVGTKVYVNNKDSSTISVIDTETDTVEETIETDVPPVYSVSVGDDIFIANQFGDTMSLLDTETNEIVDSITVGSTPTYPNFVGDHLYVQNAFSNTVSSIDMDTIPSKLPDLVSFSTSADDGMYSQGDEIPITANFGLPILAGSTMTVDLNSGGTVTLGEVSGSTISGVYVIGEGEHIPDLAISRIISADVTDSTDTYNRTEYNLPESRGDFEAENSFITRNLGDSTNIEIGNFTDIPVGDNPYQISAGVNGYVYVANQGSNNVSVIQLSDNTVVDTIDVGEEPYGLATATVSGTTYVYVANINSDDVSVINTSTNTVVATIPVGVHPYYVAAVGDKVYVTNGLSNTVYMIDANIQDVAAVIPVGTYPRGIKAHGTDLYVANYGDPNYSGGNYISVIDSTTDTVTDTIILPIGSSGPRGVNVLGDRVYVANFRSDNVSVINANTNSIIDTIDVGDGPRGVAGLGTNVYVENFNDGTVSVIDTDDNSVIDTIDVGSSPSGIVAIGSNIYLSRFQDNLVSILLPETMQLLQEEEVVEEESNETPSSGSSSPSSPSTPPPTPPTEPVVPPPPPPLIPPPVTPVVIPVVTPPAEPTAPPLPSSPEQDSPDIPSVNDEEGNQKEARNSDNVGEAVVNSVKDFVAALPEKTATTVSAVTVVLSSAAFAIAQPAVAANVISIPIRLWNLLPVWLGFRRKKRPWGTVYDSVTKQPLDPVYVTLTDARGNIVATTITDIDGRFGFLIAPGIYNITVKKDNYDFPSKKLAGKETDELYNNIYSGGTIEIKDEENLIIRNIPMDSTSFNWNEFEKSENKQLMKFYSKRELFLAKFANILFWIGLVISALVVLSKPGTLNYILFGVYVVVLILRFLGIKPKKPGYITEKETDFPLSFGVIKVFSQSLGREIAHAVIGKTGKYYVLVPKGQYYVTVSKKVGEDAYKEIYKSGVFTSRNGYIGKRLSV